MSLENQGCYMNNDDDQEIFHDAIESASENFIENHIDSQKDYDKSEKRIEKANQQSKDFKNQNKDLQEKYDVLINQVNTFEEQNNEFNEQIKVLNEKNADLHDQTKVLKYQLQVKHVVIDTHVECHEKYAKLKEERYEYMIRYSALFDNDKQHRKQIADQEFLFDKMSVELVELDKHQRSSLKPYVLNVILEKIIIDLEDEVVSLLEKEKANLETIESLKSKGFKLSQNDCHMVDKECGKVENSKVIAPGMFKLSGSQSVSPILMTKTSCDSKNVESQIKRKRRKRKSSKQNDKQVNNDVSRANRDFVHFSDLDTFSSHMTGNHALLTNFVEKFLGTVRFGNNDFRMIAGYGDVVIGKIHQKPYKSKKDFASNKPLYLLHMDLCGSMRVERINGKRVSGARFWIKMENEHELSYENLTRVYLGSYENYKSIEAEVDLLEPGFELQGSKMVEMGQFRIIREQSIAAYKGYRGGDPTNEDGDTEVSVSLGQISSKGKKSCESDMGDCDNTRDGGKITGGGIRKSSNPSVSKVSKASKKDLEDLFHNFYDEYFDSSKIMKSLTMNVDIIFGSTNSKYCTKFADLMVKHFKMSMMGEMKFFLGLQVNQFSNGIFISQSKYILDILKRFGIENYDTVSTPMVKQAKLKLDLVGKPVDHTDYRSMIRSLMYVTSSRLDIMFATLNPQHQSHYVFKILYPVSIHNFIIMSNTNNNMQTQMSNTLHTAIMEADSKDHPPTLAPDKEVPISEGSLITRTERFQETYKNVLQEIRDQLNAEAEAVQIILTGIDNDIYSTLDACPNACEMWKAIERLKHGESINVQDLETNLYWDLENSHHMMVNQ
nr:uncharacterized mitochondrial protein AtMg00810-like [Tanacetum cinerariifolium]